MSLLNYLILPEEKEMLDQVGSSEENKEEHREERKILINIP